MNIKLMYQGIEFVSKDALALKNRAGQGKYPEIGTYQCSSCLSTAGKDEHRMMNQKATIHEFSFADLQFPNYTN